jgi:tyrosine-specific transport protein
MDLNKVIGGTLLVSGTTIGVGLLGLPATCAFMGFYPSIATFILVWSFMLAAGLFFVEVVCNIKKNVNISSMAEQTIGRWGMGLSWVVYLLLMYSLVALYISGCAPIFQVFFTKVFGFSIPTFFAEFLLPLFFGWTIYLGTSGVDFINRYLMIGLLASYFLLVCSLPKYVDYANFSHYALNPIAYAIPSILTSFGYHIIIPSLGSYMNYNKKMMVYSVFFGSVIALLVNILWQFLVLGVMPPSLLGSVWQKGVPITDALSTIVNSNVLSLGVYLFSFFAILTSFLGVSLSLADFLIDGLKIKKRWEGKLLAIVLTFFPPLIFVHSYPRGFILALEYAGAFVAIILLFIPAVMVWNLKGNKFYKTFLGRGILLTIMGFSFLVIIINILIRQGFFNHILKMA